MFDDRIFLWHETGLDRALDEAERNGEFDEVDEELGGYDDEEDEDE